MNSSPINDDTATIAGSFVPNTKEEKELVKKYIRNYCRRTPSKKRLSMTELYDALGLNERKVKLNKRWGFI